MGAFVTASKQKEYLREDADARVRPQEKYGATDWNQIAAIQCSFAFIDHEINPRQIPYRVF